MIRISYDDAFYGAFNLILIKILSKLEFIGIILKKL